MARTGENIYKRKDGRWEARYLHKYDSNGKAKYRSVYGISRQEAKQKRLVLIHESMMASLSIMFSSCILIYYKAENNIMQAYKGGQKNRLKTEGRYAATTGTFVFRRGLPTAIGFFYKF